MIAWSDILVLLADAAIKATLIITLAFVGARLLRGASARARHGLWAATLVGVLLIPALSVALPGWSVPLLPALPGASIPPESDGGTGFTWAAASDPAELLSTDLPPREQGVAVTGTAGKREDAGGRRAGWGSPRNWSQALLATWLLGALLMAASWKGDC